MNPESNLPQSIDATTSERCLQYLLGELSADESVTFEQEIAKSPELVDLLQRQSKVLCELSEARVYEEQISAISADRSSVTRSSSVAPATSGSRWIEAIIALAACLLIAYVAWNSGHEAATSIPLGEDLLIAEAWADTDMISSVVELELEDEQEYEIDLQAFDESLSWVVTAVESGVSIDG